MTSDTGSNAPANGIRSFDAVESQRLALLSSMFENALSAIVAADETGQIVAWNPRCVKIFGWESDEVIGRPLHETIIPEKYRAAHQRGFAHWVKTGEGPVLGTVVELEGLRKDGSEFPIELSISPVSRGNGLATTVAFCRDLTERRAGEKGMREAAERLHELTLMQEVAERLSFTLDPDAVFAEVVRAAANMTSTASGGLRRASLLRVAGDQAESVVEFDEAGLTLGRRSYSLGDHPVLLQVVETGQPYQGDIREMPVPAATAAMLQQTDLVSAVVVPLRVGEAIYGLLIVSARDREGFSTAQVDRLEAVAQIAGLAIGNAEHFNLMRRHAERAGELEQAKSEFLKLASHELRGPLGVLRGYLSMLTEGTLDNETMQEVAPLLSAKLTQMNDLVNQMLEAARLDDSRLELERADFDFAAEATGAVDDLRALLGGQHRLIVDLPDEPLLVHGDRVRLRTVASNLVDNAIKYSPDGGDITVVVRRDGDDAVMEVTDQGIGIDPVDMPRLFQRFGRLVTPDNSHISGTGLGLYLSRRLVRMHGGDIGVRSVPHGGSTFTVRVPVQPKG
ncbi:MAG: ATP-binding protein [Candidatus Dormibacteria bacterium]